MTQQKAPLAIFAYNRRENLELMFESLRACAGFDQTPLIFFIDGPKDEIDRPKVEAVRAFVHSIAHPHIEIVEQATNKGLKTSIYEGVTDVCSRYGRVIVLEDDLILSPVALTYFNEALNKYENEPRLWSIVGYQYSAPKLKGHDTALLLPFTHPWGWATWDRAWKQYDLNAPIDPSDLSSPAFAQAFDVFGLRDFRNMIVLALAGRISCWFSPWYYKIFSNRGLSLFPPQTYVKNIGLKKGGTHSSALNPYYLLVKPDDVSSHLVTLPEPKDLKIDFWAIDILRYCWDARIQKVISHLGRIKRILFAWKVK